MSLTPRSSLLDQPRIKSQVDKAIPEMIALGQEYHRRGWCMGTSGNFSCLIERDPLILLVTASGKDKSALTENDFVIVDQEGAPLDRDGAKPSAETLLHLEAVKQFGAGSVLHTHSIWSTILSQLSFEKGHLEIEGFEMLKGLSGIKTHETKIKLPVVDNSQSMPDLIEKMNQFFSKEKNDKWAYLIRKHGMHTWGKDLQEAKRHVEILEFLLEAVGRLQTLKNVDTTYGIL